MPARVTRTGLADTRDNNVMHAKPDLRAFLKMDDRWFGLGDRCRYPALAYAIQARSLVGCNRDCRGRLDGCK